MADANMRIIITAVDNASAELGKIKTALNGVSGANNNAATSNEKLGGSFASTMSGIKSVISQVGGYIATVTAAVYAMKKAFDFAKEGASLMAVEETASKIATSMGSNLGKIVSSLQKASLGTVSYYDAVQSASNAMMLGLGADADKLANLMQIAALRGRAMGLTTTQAFSDMVRGIGRLSPLILDNLGVVIDAENRYKAYAAAIGKTAAQLTSAEKKQALLNGVLEEGNKLLAEAGGLAFTTSSAYERIDAKWKTFWGGVKEDFATGLLPLFASAEEMAQLTLNQANAALSSGDKYETYFTKMKAHYWNQNLILKENGDLYERQTVVIDNQIQTIEVLVKKHAVLSKAEAAAAQRWQGMANAAKRLQEATSGVDNVLSDLNDKVNGYLLDIGLAGDLTKMQSDYFDDLAKKGEVAKAAMSNLSESTAKWVRETAAAFGGFSATQELDIAFAFGEIDTTSYAAALAIQKYVESMQAAGASMPEMIGGLQAIKGNLDGLLTGGSATYTIDYVMRVLFQGMNVPFDLAANLLGLSASQASSALSWTLKAKASGANVGGTVFGNVTQRALGGAVRTGEPYLIGELGPELFVPQDNGTIIPNNKMSNVGGKNVTIQITYAPTISTASESELEWALKPMIQRALREA